MTERDRQRRLHVENRLEELNARYGRVDDSLPDWLDHYPEPSAPPAPPRPPRASHPPQGWAFDIREFAP